MATETAEKGNVHELVKEKYGAIARKQKSGCCEPRLSAKPSCCGPIASSKPAIGYTEEEVKLAGDANLGLGCGNPLALAAVQPGMTVLDLGSGAGFDSFLVAERVGPAGHVIGVDMTDDMIALARDNAARRGVANVEFRKGYIESLPVEDASVDLVISNCVLNLSPDKPAVFREIVRVLKPGGGLAISDIVLLRPLDPAIVRSVEAYVGCIAGASLLSDYVAMASDAGLANLSLPEIVSGKSLLGALVPETTPPDLTPAQVARAAASAVSVKLHGRKPE